jgi:hypothetical protein
LNKPVLNLILTHQPASAVSTMVTWWTNHVPIESIFIAYGGMRSEFEKIQHTPKVFVDDSRVRTRDHQREFQSYTPLFQAAGEFLNTKDHKFDFVHFAEYDHLPIAPNLNELQIARLESEHADVLGYHLHRIDGTSSAHFLYHADNAAFASYWKKITRRMDPRVVLSMFGTGSFWTRESFCAVAARAEPFPIYMEIYLPTLAHHLGFRVRDFAEQNQFVRALPHEITSSGRAREEGAWTLHPIKELWTD